MMISRLSRRDFVRISGAATVAPWLRGIPVHALASETPATQKDSQTLALCQKLRSDPLRPQFHLLPSHNWMNDPNGPIFYRDRYHMFHQYNPKGAIWGNMNWAHATSPDMIHWTHQPIAISPTPGGFDQDGVFSGSAILDHGTPTMIYTGVMPPATPAEATLRDGVHTWREVQCLATAEDNDLRTWKKLAEPIIASPPPGLEVNGFRDPYVWREADAWMLTLGSGFKHKGGAVLLYRSTDLRHWTYLHPLVEGSSSAQSTVNAVDNGEMWECPDFFPLGNKHVLLVSTMGKVHWKVGTYKDQRFTPEKEGVADWGSYYAAKTMLDRDGNRILWGWIPETRPDADLIAAGWAGVMALPRVLSLSSQNDLQMDVLPAFEKLRDPSRHTEVPSEPAARKQTLDSLRIHDLSAEIQIECRPKPDSSFTLRLQCENGDTFASITHSNRSRGQEPPVEELQVNDVKAQTTGATTQSTRLRIFLDASVLEVFANSTTAITARVYKASAGPLRLTFEGNADPTDLQVWQIQPISKDRLTGSLCD
ncbi:MAG: glycoside hydrolase family 32 protein [Terriglobales bacterium]